ncbi:unnamed protein product [Fraxinus pennsylvanica]|uniref:RNase H type-1 domain-containing protein n=1 Tax=Fraxinus pennsylvanica TaxID=56036 RepID=A0AAD2AB87_9LAMI|nr:unnamed protein product [Fraxinus pennsylvanica]
MEAIRSIPLGKFPTPDLLIWRHSKHGEYCVKYGYWLAFSIKNPVLEVSSSYNSDAKWAQNFRNSPIYHKLKMNEFEKLCMTAYQIWSDRNALYYGRSIPPVQRQCEKLEEYLADFQATQLFLKVPSREIAIQPGVSRRRFWKTPPTDELILNTDAAVNNEEGVISIGAVIRNHCGEKWIPCSRSKSSTFIFHSHALNVAEDCRLLMTRMGNCLIQHAPRRTNQVAHELALLAKISRHEFMCCEEIPESIVNLVNYDVSHMND